MAKYLKLVKTEFDGRFTKRFAALMPNIKDLHQSLMAFGCEIGPGWRELVWNLTEKIEKEVKKGKLDFEIVQVKEKFGGLRFYVNCGTRRTRKLIDNAEAESFKICEVCGETGRLGENAFHWYKTLCNKHWKEEVLGKMKAV